MEKKNEKGIVCVTGGTGFVASWLIMRLLQSGYYVNTTINNNSESGTIKFPKDDTLSTVSLDCQNNGSGTIKFPMDDAPSAVSLDCQNNDPGTIKFPMDDAPVVVGLDFQKNDAGTIKLPMDDAPAAVGLDCQNNDPGTIKFPIDDAPPIVSVDCQNNDPDTIKIPMDDAPAAGGLDCQNNDSGTINIPIDDTPSAVNLDCANNDLDGASFLKKLPNASEKLKIFSTNPEKPESFYPAMEGCNSVIIGHSVDFEDESDDETKIQRSVMAILGILKACLDSKTIKRVIYTSSDAAVCFNVEEPDVVDETVWSDIDFIKKLQPSGPFYCISKRIIEKEALNFAEKNGLDLVCVNHAWVFGPFITPRCHELVRRHMPMILQSNWTNVEYDRGVIPFVHVDDVARAHIFLLECPEAKGRYICSCVDTTPDEMSQFLRARYPQYQIPPFDPSKVTMKKFKFPSLSSKKLLDAGFNYKYNLGDMYDGAITSCKRVGLL